MAFTDSTITATDELSVTIGAGGAVFADIIPSSNKAYILGKLGVGTLNPGNDLDVAGGLSVSQDASLAVNGGSVGIGTASPMAKLDVAGTLRTAQDTSLAVTSGNVGIGPLRRWPSCRSPAGRSCRAPATA